MGQKHVAAEADATKYRKVIFWMVLSGIVAILCAVFTFFPGESTPVWLIIYRAIMAVIHGGLCIYFAREFIRIREIRKPV